MFINLAYICNSLIISQIQNNKLPIIKRIAYDERKPTQNTKSIMIDIDGTICKTENSDYHKSIPIKNKIKMFNELYDSGHEIHYWTARGVKSGINWEYFTILQLKEWNVKYSSLNVGKPHYDIWIDDKAIRHDEINSFIYDLKYNMTEYDDCILNCNDGCECLHF